jgi:type IV pilus assembly protein PilC
MLAALNKIFGIVRQQKGDLHKAFLGMHELFLNNPRRFHKLTADTTGLMLYLIGIVVLAVVTASIYLIFVLPEFENLFRNQGAELPMATALLLQLSQGPASSIFLLLLVLILSPAIVLNQLRSKINRLEFVGGFVRRIPLLGCVADEYNYYLSLCLLRIFDMAGLREEQALNILKQQYVITVSGGDDARHTDAALATAIQMGTFSYELQHQLEQHQSCGDDEFDNFKDAVSISGIVVVASIVGVLVMAMYLPIFQLGKILG